MRGAVICPTCSKEKEFPLALVRDEERCEKCIRELLKKIKFFMHPYAYFTTGKKVVCDFTEPCSLVKAVFEHRDAHRDDPAHVPFWVALKY